MTLTARSRACSRKPLPRTGSAAYQLVVPVVPPCDRQGRYLRVTDSQAAIAASTTAVSSAAEAASRDRTDIP
ncbi:hypothetical protein SAMN04487818_101533 [Actinokineospora terrae]|uniref:Uncharacterized protein n=1 Tax=Actinokineospora terrae TaxID=155974 RepID=A0A1H9LBR7_9PSEU|nr:hypothetical protein SAMN04487818_101533 [Actinokineospora terrae]